MMLIRPASMLFSCAMASLGATAALAQATNYTSVEAIAGKPIQLTYHATAHKSTCTPSPAPTVHVLQPPKDGVLTIRRADLTTDRIAGCPHLKTPAQVVFYQAKEGYLGSDKVRYEVTAANGEVGIYEVIINVKPAQVPTGPEVPKTETSL
jgi:hypothetical protein